MAVTAASVLSGCAHTHQNGMTGTMVGVVPFDAVPPVNDSAIKLATHTGELVYGTRVVPNRAFFVRTSAGSSGPAKIELSGGNGKPVLFTMRDVFQRAHGFGPHVLESALNGRSNGYGLMGAANISGMKGDQLVEAMGSRLGSTSRLLVEGDGDVSWIFSVADFASGYLITHMNESWLEHEHGSACRWFLPEWFGCTSIKWVRALRVVPDDAPATPYMLSMAAATLQEGKPVLARDFKPARTGLAAVPLRVEEWRDGAASRYRVVGLRWGMASAQGPTDLQIRFSAAEPWQPLSGVEPADPTMPHGWTWWHHEWTPSQRGAYTIQLRPRDERVLAPRLRRGDYDRGIHI